MNPLERAQKAFKSLFDPQAAYDDPHDFGEVPMKGTPVEQRINYSGMVNGSHMEQAMEGVPGKIIDKHVQEGKHVGLKWENTGISVYISEHEELIKGGAKVAGAVIFVATAIKVGRIIYMHHHQDPGEKDSKI